jgi:hypothetical protein
MHVSHVHIWISVHACVCEIGCREGGALPGFSVIDCIG